MDFNGITVLVCFSKNKQEPNNPLEANTFLFQHKHLWTRVTSLSDVMLWVLTEQTFIFEVLKQLAGTKLHKSIKLLPVLLVFLDSLICLFVHYFSYHILLPSEHQLCYICWWDQVHEKWSWNKISLVLRCYSAPVYFHIGCYCLPGHLIQGLISAKACFCWPDKLLHNKENPFVRDFRREQSSDILHFNWICFMGHQEEAVCLAGTIILLCYFSRSKKGVVYL